MATRTISVAGGNFNATGTWDEGVVPVAGDDVVARGGGDSGNLNISANAGGVGLLSLNFTNYSGQLNMNTFAIFVAGSITMSPTMTSTGTGKLIPNATGTLTANTHSFSGAISIRGTSPTITLADAWVIAGILDTAGSGTMTLNGSTISAGGLTIGGGTLSGTTVITLTGGTWSGGIALSNNLTFAGDVTITGLVKYVAPAGGTSTITRTSGTITTTGSTLELQGGATHTVALNCNGMTFNTVSLVGNTNLLSLTSALSAVTLSWGAAADITVSGAAGFTVDYFTSVANGAPKSITLTQTNTYTVTTSMTVQGASTAFYRLIASSSGSLLVPFNLQVDSQDVRYVRATRVDSSGGQTIHTSGVNPADIATSLNWDIIGGGFMWLG